MRRVNLYILVVFIGILSLFTILAKDAQMAKEANSKKVLTVAKTDKPFSYNGIQQDEVKTQKRTRVNFNFKKSPNSKKGKVLPFKDNKPKEVSATEKTKKPVAKDILEVKLDENGNPIDKKDTVEVKEAEADDSNLIIIRKDRSDYSLHDAENFQDEVQPAATVVDTIILPQDNSPTVGSSNASDAIDQSQLLTEWQNYLFSSPSEEKFSEFVRAFKNDAVTRNVFYTISSDAISDDSTKEFALDMLAQIKDSQSFTILAETYSTADSDFDKAIFNELNTYSMLENVGLLRNVLNQTQSRAFPLALSVIKLSIDQNLNNSEASISVFSEFVPVFTALNTMFDEEQIEKLAVFDLIYTSLLALSNDSSGEFSV